MKARIKTLEEFGGVRPEHWDADGYMDELFGLTVDAECDSDEECYVESTEEGEYFLLHKTDFAEILEA